MSLDAFDAVTRSTVCSISSERASVRIVDICLGRFEHDLIEGGHVHPKRPRHLSRPSRSLRHLSVILLGLALVASACSDDADDTTTTSAAPTTTAAPAGDDTTTTAAPGGDDTTTTAAPPAEGATFVMAVPGLPTSFDNQANPQGDPQRWTHYELASNLVLYDAQVAGLADDGCTALAGVDAIRGELAESWEWNDDRTELTFFLRQGVLSPDGNEMTSEDVKWSLDRGLAEGRVVRFLAYRASHFVGPDEGDPVIPGDSPYEIVDDYTIKVNIADPTAIDAALFTYHQFQIWDTTALEPHITAEDPWAKEFIELNFPNFGPWMIESFDPGNEVVYVRNPNYWNNDGIGNVDRFILRAIPEASTRFQLLQSGDVDYVNRLQFDQYLALQDDPNVTVKSCQSPNREPLVLNLNDERFADVRVRQAVSKAIDRETLVAGAYLNFAAIPSTTGLSAVYDIGSPELVYEYDPDEARQLLADAGYPNGFDVTLTYSTTRPGAHVEQASILVQNMLRDVGINTTFDVVASGSDFRQQFTEGRYAAMMYLEPPAIADPYYSGNLYNQSQSNNNSHDYESSQYDTLIKQIEQTPPGPDREALLEELSDLIVTDIPMVYMVEPTYLHAFRSNITNYIAPAHGEVMVFNLIKQ